MKNTITLKSFAALGGVEARRVIHAEDRRKAEALRRAKSLPKPSRGPKVAR